MRSSLGDLLSLHSMFIDWCTEYYERGCRCRDYSSIGTITLSHSYSGRSQTMKKVLSDEHLGRLITMHNLAFSLQFQASHTEAIALMERCFQLCQQILGEQHLSHSRHSTRCVAGG
jgi:hypothetical protein